jgi:hypothetical protein
LKRFAAITIMSFLLGIASTVINCNGTRIRTTENDISSAQVLANLNALPSASAQSLDGGSSSSMLTQFIADVNDATQGYTLYYGQAPSMMADIPTQIADFANTFAGFPTAPSLPVSEIMVYFIASADGTRAGLVIAGYGGAAPAATAAANPAASPTSSISSTVTPNFYYVALNDGSSYSTGSLQAGSFSNVDYEVDLNLDGVSTLTLQTEDLSSGDLADTLQFDVYNTSAGTYIGRFNVTQPE